MCKKMVKTSLGLLLVLALSLKIVRCDVTDADLQQISEELLAADNANNAGSMIQITDLVYDPSEEEAPSAPLLSRVDRRVWNKDTISKLIDLLQVYGDTTKRLNKARVLLTSVMQSQVWLTLSRFFRNKGIPSPDLRTMFFTSFRQHNRETTAFEHIFRYIVIRQEVKGLHNWVFFHRQEGNNNVKYIGYTSGKKVDLIHNEVNKGTVMDVNFKIKFDGDKEYQKKGGSSTMFVGTSPELEMTLYTLCYITRPDTRCRLKLAGNFIDIQTYSTQVQGTKIFTNAYPMIPRK